LSKLVLGLTGPNAAGKGEVAAYLLERGFALHSLSDIVREEAARRGLGCERAQLIQVGNALRKESGPGVLAQRILARLGERDVVDSIRNPAEVQVLRQLRHFVLVGVRASLEGRFRRTLERARPGDPLTLEEFRERERQENSPDAKEQRLDATLALADEFLDNDTDLETLHRRIDGLLEAREA
jgi:dephospho-CoA kinase